MGVIADPSSVKQTLVNLKDVGPLFFFLLLLILPKHTRPGQQVWQ
jgi:hypothetical protein